MVLTFFGYLDRLGREQVRHAIARTNSVDSRTRRRPSGNRLALRLSAAHQLGLRGFDTVSSLQHPRHVVTFSRRLAALATVLTLYVGNLAVCAGWQATAEARMECCKNGTSCPMHKSEAHGSRSTPAMTQAQADTCCAASSSRTESPTAVSSFALVNAAALPALVPSVVPVAVHALEGWRALVPLLVSPVPKHLLLSVLLV